MATQLYNKLKLIWLQVKRQTIKSCKHACIRESEIEKVPVIKNYADAIVMTEKELMKVLEKNQVRRIYPLNQKFNHNFHEAIAHVESELEEETVIQVIQAGYSIADRLIRPALVAVAKKKEV